MAVVDLGKLRFDWRGDFSPSVAYEDRDVVRYQGDIYIFTATHAIGGWNPSEASLMLVSADVTQEEGDIIIADASGLQTRLPVVYDHANAKGKVLTSVSTTPATATVTKAITIANDAYYVDGVRSLAPLDVATLDTIVFDTSDVSNTGHNFAFSSLENGIHGDNSDTHVSTISNGSVTHLQVSSAAAEITAGGTSIQTLRTIYSYVSDATTTPTYIGTEYPYIVVKGTITKDAGVTATLGTQNVGGVNVLTINGRPAYQSGAETDYTSSDAVSELDWVCFDASGNTNNVDLTNPTSFSFEYNTAITYAGTPGTAGSTATWVVPVSATTLYVYDKQEALTPAVGFTLEPYTHIDTASVTWDDAEAPGKIIKVYRNIHTGGAWQTSTSWATIPGTNFNFVPERSDTKIRYRLNYAYSWQYTSHAIQHMTFNWQGGELAKWSLGGTHKEGRDTLEWTVDSPGAGVACNFYVSTREYGSNSNSLGFHRTYYWNGGGSTQNCHAQLEITEFIE